MTRTISFAIDIRVTDIGTLALATRITSTPEGTTFRRVAAAYGTDKNAAVRILRSAMRARRAA